MLAVRKITPNMVATVPTKRSRVSMGVILDLMDDKLGVPNKGIV